MIDWTDERAIGLKCWANDPSIKKEVLGQFVRINPTYSNYPYEVNDVIDSVAGCYESCRLAQGEKTKYDGKGQPVPDGVMVEVWFINGDSSIYLSDNWIWNITGDILYYQVQEQPEEKQTRHNIPSNTTSVVNAVTGERKMIKSKTVPIKQSTVNEIVECLEIAREDRMKLLRSLNILGWELTSDRVIKKLDHSIKELSN